MLSYVPSSNLRVAQIPNGINSKLQRKMKARDILRATNSDVGLLVPQQNRILEVLKGTEELNESEAE